MFLEFNTGTLIYFFPFISLHSLHKSSILMFSLLLLLGFFSHGVVIVDRIKIFKNYCAKKFIYDIVLNICWLISLDSDASMWFKTMGLLRIIVLMKLLSEIE